jgi:hypothetical protein
MISDIDKSNVLSSGAIGSPVLGIISPLALSGGVKTLILIKKMPEELFNASQCGDNCAPWLLRLGKEGDVTINLSHIMNFGSNKFDIYIVNTGETVHDMYSLALTAGRFV